MSPSPHLVVLLEMARTKTTKKKSEYVGTHSMSKCSIIRKDKRDPAVCSCLKRCKAVMVDTFSQTEHIVGSYHRRNIEEEESDFDL